MEYLALIALGFTFVVIFEQRGLRSQVADLREEIGTLNQDLGRLASREG